MSGDSGLTPLDRQVASMLRRTGVHIQLVVNKCDSRELDTGAAEFATLGLGEPICVSAAHRRGRSELFACIRAHLDDGESAAPPSPVMRIGARS